MINYKIIYSNRRTLALEVTRECEVIVRAPKDMSDFDIEDFVAKHTNWIEKSKIKINQRNESRANLTPDQEKELKILAKEILPKKVDYYSNLMNLKPSALHITSAKTRFGSCSGKNSISLSWRLMMYDEYAIDYVVVHELAHIKHHNHSKQFYALIEKYLPDYKQRASILKK